MTDYEHILAKHKTFQNRWKAYSTTRLKVSDRLEHMIALTNDILRTLYCGSDEFDRGIAWIIACKRALHHAEYFQELIV